MDTNIDTSKIPNFDKRKQLEALLAAQTVATEARDDAYAKNAEAMDKLDNQYHERFGQLRTERHDADRAVKGTFQPRFDALANERNAACQKIQDDYHAKVGALRAERDAQSPIAAEAAAMEAADKAVADFELGAAYLSDEDGEPIHCALSGVILLDSDEIIEDSETGEKVLRCLVLPPREGEVEETDDENADATEEVAA